MTDKLPADRPPADRLLDFWRSVGDYTNGAVLLEPSAGERVAAALEERYAITLPPSFRDYVVRAAPGAYGIDTHDYLICSWWGADRICNLPDGYEGAVKNAAVADRSAVYILFADWALWCGAWAICCGDSADRGRIMVINGGDDRFVADSFDDFVDWYMQDVSDLI